MTHVAPLCTVASVRQRTDQPQGPAQTYFQFAARSSVHSLLDPGKEAASHERAFGSLRQRIDAPLAQARRLFAREVSRLELGAKVRPYLLVVTVSNVSAILRRKGAVAKRRGFMMAGIHDPVAAVRPNGAKRFFDVWERLWCERPRALYRRVARGYPGEFLKLLDSAIDHVVPKFTNPPRMLKEQLTAEAVSVWISAGCLAEFGKIATVAAARARQADEPYTSCLQREIVTLARFIREWTHSDKFFDQTQWGELVSVARKYALPRAWRLYETVASEREYTVVAGSPAQGVLKRVSDREWAPRRR